MPVVRSPPAVLPAALARVSTSSVAAIRSLGHPDRIAATLDVETRARAAGKTAGGDLTTGIGIAELMLGEARSFVAAHKNDKLD
jgi:hypothetical protein